jgi:hypothetical protein
MTISIDSASRPSFVLSPLAVDVACDDTTLRIRLADGRELTTSTAWFPRLAAATAEQRSTWELIGGGEGIHWPEIDEDISVASLLGLPSD